MYKGQYLGYLATSFVDFYHRNLFGKMFIGGGKVSGLNAKNLATFFEDGLLSLQLCCLKFCGCNMASRVRRNVEAILETK